MEKSVMTNKMENMTRANVKLVRKELNNTLEALGKRLGLSFTVGRIAYDDYSLKASVDAALTDKPGETKMAIDFKKMCDKYGFRSEDLGTTFVSNGTLYEIVGLKPRNRKYPIIVKRVEDGKQFKFAATTVRMYV